MVRLLVTASLLLCLLAGAACSDGASKETIAPEAWTLTANDPKFTYVRGFFDEERNATGQTWRWMEPDGIVALKNTGGDAVLTLQGSCPLGPLQGAPTIKITFNEQVLDEFPGTANFQKSYAIPVAKHGRFPYSDLRITSSKSFVPQEVSPKLQDNRRLALQISQLTWEAAAPPPAR